MPAAEESDEQLFDDLVLADDHTGQLFFDLIEAVAELADGLQVVLADGSPRRLGR